MSVAPRRGFTLVELMIAIAVMAILLALAAPDFGEAVQRGRLQGASAELVGAVQLARSEAVRANRRVVLCRSTDGSSCNAADNVWTGWIVFIDTDGDGARGVNEPVIKAGSFGAVTVLASPAITAGAQKIVFRGDGTARGTDGRTLLAGTLAVCVAATRPAANVRDVSLAFGTRTAVRSRSAGGLCAAPADA